MVQTILGLCDVCRQLRRIRMYFRGDKAVWMCKDCKREEGNGNVVK